MPQLTEPTAAVHASFLTWIEEVRTADGTRAAAPGTSATALGREIREWGSHWHEPAAFARYVARLKDPFVPDAGKGGEVPTTTLWYVDGREFLGRISVRHCLTGPLYEYGGHIGYGVRPSARRRGYATAMLREALPYAHRIGIDDVLVTCDHDNAASRKVIEACGGVFEDRRGGKLRYWISTSQPEPLRLRSTA